MILSHVKMYFYFLANFIRSQYIVPNEEMMSILTNFFSDIIFQERKEINSLDEENKSKMNDLNISSTPGGPSEINDLYKNKSYIIYMKYCFTRKEMLKSKTMVDMAMKNQDCSNVVIKLINKINTPEILIKINDFIFTSKFYTPKKLFRDVESMFEENFDNYNLDISLLDMTKLKEITLNLIQYGIELKDKQFPVGYLMNSLYLMRNLNNKNNINININDKEE